MRQAALPLIVAAVASTLSTGFAETIRPLMSRENRLPEKNQLEVGTLLSYQQFDETDETAWQADSAKRHEGTIDLYARFGLFDNLSLFASVPYGFINSDAVGKHNGIRDIRAGLELLAYEHTYGYPYVLPYCEISIPAGNADKKLGTGDVGAKFGTAIGTTVHYIYHYVLDGQYEYSQTGNKSEGLFGLSAAFIWDLNEQFSVLLEAKITEKPAGSEDNMPVFLKGGMCYEVNRNLSIYWYGGGAVNTQENGSGHIKIAYRF